MAFRGSDESLDQEIASIESIVRIRLRRYSREMIELDRDLRELRKERVRRKAAAVGVEMHTEETPAEGQTADP